MGMVQLNIPNVWSANVWGQSTEGHSAQDSVHSFLKCHHCCKVYPQAQTHHVSAAETEGLAIQYQKMTSKWDPKRLTTATASLPRTSEMLSTV